MKEPEIDLRIHFLERFILEKFKSSEEALRVALDAANKRLDTMNEFRQALNDQNSTFLTKDEFQAAYHPLVEKVSEQGKPNWTIVASFASLFLGSIAAIWLVLGLKIDNSAAPLTLAIEQLKSTELDQLQRYNTIDDTLRRVQANISEGQQFAVSSKEDRQQINAKLRILEDSVAANVALVQSQITAENITLIKIQDQIEFTKKK